jgi:hypothetical protein
MFDMSGTSQYPISDPYSGFSFASNWNSKWIECHCVERIVALTTEVELLDENPPQVFGGLDAALFRIHQSACLSRGSLWGRNQPPERFRALI